MGAVVNAVVRFPVVVQDKAVVRDKAAVRRALAAVEQWLSTLEPEDPELLESGADDLRHIGELMLTGAGKAELADAVAAARAAGWAWSPIAMLLDTSPDQARRSFS
ncbi:hypothetical protein BKA01_001573 [Pseudonocardia eucalypti]|uniref:hypothetical protein n=1 Tax=Pseudonocardia eucalypti TaxID=648755 RepID=UPI00160E5FD3|nr:hypothetical protein [Pseudonocardia eucalypti]